MLFGQVLQKIRNPYSRHPCRCNHCGARRTLARHPDYYVRPHFARCHLAGCPGQMRVDKYRIEKELKRRTLCREDCWPFPHVKGSAGCIHHPRAEEFGNLYQQRAYC